MHRTQTTTLAFAAAAAIVTVLSTALSYVGLRAAFEREFDAALVKVDTTAAFELSAKDLSDLGPLGPDGNAYLALQAQLDMFRALSGVDNFAFVDSAGNTAYDVRRGELAELQPSPYDSLAHGALRRALAGAFAIAPIYGEGGGSRAAFAPVRQEGRVLGVVVAESRPAWRPELLRLRRRLIVIALVSVAAIAVLAGILMRGTARQIALERRLSRSENLAAMGRLTATLAHEIRNPLAIIRGSAKRMGRLEPEAQSLADSLVEEVDRLGRTLTRYLEFARGESAPSETGDAAAALTATLDLLEGEFRARRCVLERGPIAAGAVVALDPESLKQVCLNLALNALEAMPEGGRVRAGLETRAGHAELTVHDEGPGIPAAVLQRLGEPFLTTKAQGTGLGLFLTRRLVERAGGRLEAVNAPGGGAAVTVRLPLVRG